MPTFRKFFKKLDICSPWLAVILLIIVVLRIPNFFEPYWYGDEGIYLTIGNALGNGAKLYAEIVDHKTPLIYYLANVGSQLNFRILLVFWMLAATTAFHSFACSLFKTQRSTIIATLIFALLTTLPALEGNIPNGELFVIGFVMVGLWVLSKTSYFQNLLDQDSEKKHKYTPYLLLVSGGLFGLGILVKVPGLLDLGVALCIGWFTLIQKFSWKTRKDFFKKQLPRVSLHMLLIMLGVAIPILFSVLYYTLRGTGEAYLNFGLLYNLHYSGTWKLSFENPVLEFLFSLPGKVAVMGLGVIILSLASRVLTPQVQLIVTWILVTLFASLLSNRPYPHYFLQIVPPVSLLVGLLFDKYKSPTLFKHLFVAAITFSLIIGVFVQLGVRRYPTASYYQRAYKLVTGGISQEEYRNSFNHLIADNYRVAPVIAASKNPYMFIWGTNPTLYALTNKQPTGRFTVSFHVTDLNAYDETYWDFVSKEPEFVVVMNDERTPLPGLAGYLQDNYIPNFSYDNFVLWRKRTVSGL